MTATSSFPELSSARTDPRPHGLLPALNHALLPVRAVAKAAVFLLKVYPMLPSRPVDWVTKTPRVEKVSYPSRAGRVEGEIYRPPDAGPHPAVVVCLGVVPFGVDHPQVPVLGKALARAGIVALLYWSPNMRDFRLDPADVEDIALAYRWLVDQPYVDPARSGLIGTCVGGSFALMAAASPLIRDRIAFIFTYAPFSSMWTFARDIASATRSTGEERQPWQVDPLTRKVFVHSVTAALEPAEARRLRQGFEEGNGGQLDPRSLSPDGQAVYRLLIQVSAGQAEAALRCLPPAMQARLDALSPLNYLREVRAPLIIQLHDVGDGVIPVSESRALHAALAGRAGAHYTEMQFQHLDPVKARLPLPRLLGELGKVFRAVLLIFRQAVTAA
jgi:hypothetical protein